MTSTLKHKGKHRKSFPALDKAIEESYPVGYEVVDQVHKESRKDLKGQFIYAALLDIDRKQYIATIKLDDTAVDTRGHFKDIKIKERPLYAGQLQAVVDLPADRNVTVQQLIDYVKADFSESSLFSEEMPTVPDYNGLRFSIADYSLDEQSDIIDILTPYIGTVVDKTQENIYVEVKNEFYSHFSQKSGRIIPAAKRRVRYSIPKNFFTHHIKWKKGCLHFSTQIRSNCPVRTPWIISGDRKFSRESTHLYLLFKTRVSPFFIGIATLPGA